jgi:SAM-dependent methyltransferase
MAAAEEGGTARAAYDHIAPHYDEFTAHHDYELWLGNLLPAARRLGLRGSRLLDVACGTGKSFLPLLRRGWQVTGCDISESMLERARAKVGDRARLELADMRSLPVFGSFDLVLCLDDAINYLLNPEELVRCLRGLRRNLAPGGIVLFDVNTLRSYRTFFASTEVHDTPEGRMIWRGRASPRAEPGSTFEAIFEVDGRSDNGQAHSSAVHRQRHHRPPEILHGLDGAGLRCLAVFGHGLDARLAQPLDEARHTKAIFIAEAERPEGGEP